MREGHAEKEIHIFLFKTAYACESKTYTIKDTQSASFDIISKHKHTFFSTKYLLKIILR